jgi:hypothetical protein
MSRAAACMRDRALPAVFPCAVVPPRPEALDGSVPFPVQDVCGVCSVADYPKTSLYWLDQVQRVTGLIMTQILPFADQRALQLYGQFESGVYNAVKAA